MDIRIVNIYVAIILAVIIYVAVFLIVSIFVATILIAVMLAMSILTSPLTYNDAARCEKTNIRVTGISAPVMV